MIWADKSALSRSQQCPRGPIYRPIVLKGLRIENLGVFKIECQGSEPNIVTVGTSKTHLCAALDTASVEYSKTLPVWKQLSALSLSLSLSLVSSCTHVPCVRTPVLLIYHSFCSTDTTVCRNTVVSEEDKRLLSKCP